MAKHGEGRGVLIECGVIMISVSNKEEKMSEEIHQEIHDDELAGMGRGSDSEESL